MPFVSRSGYSALLTRSEKSSSGFGMGFTTRQIDEALRAKGFRRRESHHAMYILYQGEQKTSVRTRLSHGRKEYDDRLLTQMARQVGLSRVELYELIQCPMTQQRYLDLLRQRGRIDDQGRRGRGPSSAQRDRS